jgi:predicted nucleic acid-binding protein
MKASVVDTDVVSMLFKGDTRALAYRVHVTGRLLGISFMTLAELERWSLERGWGPRRKRELAQHLTHYAVLPVSRELCLKWAEVAFAAKRRGRPVPNRRCLDCSQRTLLSGTPDHQQSKRLFVHPGFDRTFGVAPVINAESVTGPEDRKPFADFGVTRVN